MQTRQLTDTPVTRQHCAVPQFFHWVHVVGTCSAPRLPPTLLVRHTGRENLSQASALTHHPTAAPLHPPAVPQPTNTRRRSFCTLSESGLRRDEGKLHTSRRNQSADDPACECVFLSVCDCGCSCVSKARSYKQKKRDSGNFVISQAKKNRVKVLFPSPVSPTILPGCDTPNQFRWTTSNGKLNIHQISEYSFIYCVL